MRKYLFVLSLYFAMTGCAVVTPFVQDYNVVSVPQEIQIGQEAAKEVASQMQLSQDTALTARIRAMGNRLVQALPRKDYNYEFYVVNDKTPNAFTIPGGKIYVHTGLINFASNDNEIYGVMAHEIGHAYQRHPAQAISRQYGAQALSQVLFGGSQSQLKSIAVQMAQGSILNYYGREDEFEADETGFYILQRAGVATNGLISFFTKLQTIDKGSSAFAFLSSHPPTPARIQRLQELESGVRKPTLVFQTIPS